jgi:hypothetical protein
MIYATLALSIFTFFLGRSLGQIYRKREHDQDESVAELANHFYAKGYGAAIKEFGAERRLPQKLEIVAGTDTERAS